MLTYVCVILIGYLLPFTYFSRSANTSSPYAQKLCYEGTHSPITEYLKYEEKSLLHYQNWHADQCDIDEKLQLSF